MQQQTITDLSDYGFWSQDPDTRARIFAELRAEQPVRWVRQPATPVFPEPDPEDGFWAALSHADIRRVSRDHETFCSSQGIHLDSLPPEMLEAAASFLGMDNPRHASVRGLVQKAFSMRAVRQITDQIEHDAQAVVDQLADDEGGDFVQRVSMRLPAMTIARMLGVPEADRETMLTAVEDMVSSSDEEYLEGREGLEVLFGGVVVLATYAMEMAERRRTDPADDLISALVEAELDGEKLSDAEIGAFFVLLASAGNDTTRQTTSAAMYELTRNPDQRALLLADLPGRINSAIEEFVRHSTPVMTFARTATCDTELGGQAIRKGEKVVLFYSSGNRDEKVFENPDAFDILRNPNDHLGFGGGGAHYCMGAPIAKAQLRALFTRLLTTYPELTVAQPSYIPGHFMNAIRSMPMHTGPRA
ncbi:cytochrome P450 [Mycolicibacterium sp. CBMA 226]|uniref:cytochrome P450 n=1 Tax=Mycolicibacterium sp. CBMA 226 TaxID=2606611 RepID=UPI0013058551|nr:cytochrome P450 [Mycolicibacterium sp. CBMA 226]MUL78699.1 cytochrome P450 [Mycolicibacterium sp. CBMA 226]